MTNRVRWLTSLGQVVWLKELHLRAFVRQASTPLAVTAGVVLISEHWNHFDTKNVLTISVLLSALGVRLLMHERTGAKAE